MGQRRLRLAVKRFNQHATCIEGLWFFGRERSSQSGRLGQRHGKRSDVEHEPTALWNIPAFLMRQISSPWLRLKQCNNTIFSAL